VTQPTRLRPHRDRKWAGGYVAAIRAAQLGLKTAVVEMAPQPGGTCLHWGCIPTKALLHAAEVLEMSRHAAKFGVKMAAGELDIDGLHKYKDKVVQSNAKGVEFLFKKNGITLVPGRGTLAGPGKVTVTAKDGGTRTLTTKHTIVATGSAIRGLPGVAFDGKQIINSDHRADAEEDPGVDDRAGSRSGRGRVRLHLCLVRLEGHDRRAAPPLDPVEDAALGAELEKAFKRRGLAVHTGTKVEKVEAGKSSVKVTASKDGKAVELEAEILLVAIGRRPLTEDLGLEAAGAKLDRGFIEVDGMMRTAAPGVYAIGDIVKTQALRTSPRTRGSSRSRTRPGKSRTRSTTTRSRPARTAIPKWPRSGSARRRPKARAGRGRRPVSVLSSRQGEDPRGHPGFVRIVTDKKYDEIVGVHIIGPHATELISEATAASTSRRRPRRSSRRFTPTPRWPKRWARPRSPFTAARSTSEKEKARCALTS
jgi:dihydrolipoamide dehydrogenase